MKVEQEYNILIKHISMFDCKFCSTAAKLYNTTD